MFFFHLAQAIPKTVLEVSIYTIKIAEMILVLCYIQYPHL